MVPSPGGGPLEFGRDRRVRKRREFVHVQGVARRVTTRHYVLLVAAREPPGAGPARLGLVVTKKIGNAVARNRVKRVCRECFRQWPEWLPSGVDLVVVARLGAETLGLAEVRAEWKDVSGLVRNRAEEALARARAMPHGSHGPGRGRGAPKP
jgi:ribonuclease P protein component